jgi:hypothetical protein
MVAKMSQDLSYQNVVHKRMGGKKLVVPTGCAADIESGGALSIGDTNYISTDGKIVEQYESKTTEATILSNYGVSYVGGTTSSQINYYLPAGTANVIKRVVVKQRTSTGAVVVTSSGCQIETSTDSTGSIITAAEYQNGGITLIARTSTAWNLLDKTTSLVIT